MALQSSFSTARMPVRPIPSQSPSAIGPRSHGGVAHGTGDLAGRHVVGRLAHLALVLVARRARVVGHERGEPLGDAPGRHDPHPLRPSGSPTCSATGTMFLLFGRMTTSSAGAASTAASSSAVDGFIDWPPVTIRCTPSEWKMRRTPSPVDTATTAVHTGSVLGRSSGTTSEPLSRTHRSSSTCSSRSVTRMFRGRPQSRAASMLAPMSSVWMWQFQMPSPPTTTIESPMPAQTCLKVGMASSVGLEEVHDLVAEVADVAVRLALRVHVVDRHLDVDLVDVDRLGHRPPVGDVEHGVEEQQEARRRPRRPRRPRRGPGAARACGPSAMRPASAAASATSTSARAVRPRPRPRPPRARR